MDLIPPSHFSSPPSNGSHDSEPEENLDEDPVAVLKTPDDFLIKPDPRKCVEAGPSLAPRRGISNVSRRFCHQPRSHSASRFDSGYGWMKQSRFSEPGNDNQHAVLEELEEENKALKSIIKAKSHLTQKEKPSTSNLDIITHQVQFIERLQIDITDLTIKLNKRTEELATTDKQLKEEKQVNMNQREDCRLIAAKEKSAREENMRLLASIDALKTEIQDVNMETKQQEQRHNREIAHLKSDHEEKIKIIEENFQTIKQEMIKRFNEERDEWTKEKTQLENDCKVKINQSVDETNQRHIEHLEAQKLELSKSNQDIMRLRQLVERESENVQILKNQNTDLQTELQNSFDLFNKKQAECDQLQKNFDIEQQNTNTLKTYVAKIQADNLANSQWKEDKMNLLNKIQIVEGEKVELVKTLEVMKIRFDSVSKILETQEASINAHTRAIPDVHRQNKAGVVTSEWRAKVFELMVQCKSQEIVTRDEASKYKLIIKGLNTNLEEQKRESSILSSRVEDVSAQLQLKEHIQQTLEGSNKKITIENEDLKTAIKQNEFLLAQMKNAIHRASEGCQLVYQANFSKCMEGLLRLEQRLAFANNRLRTLQDLLLRRDTMWRIRVQRIKESHVTKDQPIKTDEARPEVTVEVVKLMEERDMLSHRLAHDAAHFEKSLMESKRRENELERSNQELQKCIVRNEEEIQELKSNLEDCENTLEERNVKIGQLDDKLKQARTEKQSEIDRLVAEENAKHENDMTEMENKLKQAKRELTKSVVSLRQTERNSVREKTRFNEQLELERESWLTEERKLRHDMCQLQKDNALMLTTLRQEGLVAAYKAARGKPVVDTPSLDPPKRVHFETHNDPSPPSTDVNQLLKDLTNLSENVLNESESD